MLGSFVLGVEKLGLEYHGQSKLKLGVLHAQQFTEKGLALTVYHQLNHGRQQSHLIVAHTTDMIP